MHLLTYYFHSVLLMTSFSRCDVYSCQCFSTSTKQCAHANKVIRYFCCKCMQYLLTHNFKYRITLTRQIQQHVFIDKRWTGLGSHNNFDKNLYPLPVTQY